MDNELEKNEEQDLCNNIDNNEVVVTVNMTSKLLFNFMMVNSYIRLSGKVKWWITALFLGLIPFSIMYGEMTLTFVLILLIFMNAVAQPLSFLSSSKNQMLNNEMFRHPMKYTFSDEGLKLEAYRNKGMAKWEELTDVIETKDFILVYASKIQAFIVPKQFIKSPADLEAIKKIVEAQGDIVKYKFKNK